ncbi:hypothetical protein [Streptomyces sp. NPDC054854]
MSDLAALSARPSYPRFILLLDPPEYDDDQGYLRAETISAANGMLIEA